MVVEEPLIAGTDFRPALLRLLLIGLQLAVQLLEFLDQALELFAEAGKRFRRLRFLVGADFQALVPREEFQRQALELIEHVAEEFGELVLSCTEFVQINAAQTRRRPQVLADRLTRLHAR